RLEYREGSGQDHLSGFPLALAAGPRLHSGGTPARSKTFNGTPAAASPSRRMAPSTLLPFEPDAPSR
ncbi:MAG: hypothetical protein ACK56I_14265, partial [bacterium]